MIYFYFVGFSYISTSQCLSFVFFDVFSFLKLSFTFSAKKLVLKKELGYITYMWTLKNKNELIYKTETDLDIENRLLVTKGEVGAAVGEAGAP